MGKGQRIWVTVGPAAVVSAAPTTRLARQFVIGVWQGLGMSTRPDIAA
jgi:hypothetical protein